MLSSLLRPSRGQRSKPTSQSRFSSPYAQSSPFWVRRSSVARRRHVSAEYDEIDDDDDDDDDDDNGDEDLDFEEDDREDGGDNGEDGNDDEVDEDEGPASPLLPIFEASHLDSLPVYNLTHTLRLLMVSRCETTLSWDQLRSPQVSQFLVKPIQQEILASHFSRATIYALMANYLQFNKEAEMNPGNSGACRTRAMVSELLAIKLLREYSTRELIDALSYDFDPLRGDPSKTSSNDVGLNRRSTLSKQAHRVARVSTLEIAIRGQAKRLLAHPLVVQQLEAIWAGTIVFHSAADSLHRRPTNDLSAQGRGYGTIGSSRVDTVDESARSPLSKRQGSYELTEFNTRRSVSLYDPRDASLFKLSRLRVPRYRSFFSTCSLAVLLGLFTAVLHQRSTDITILEVLFVFWSAGFMLDEVLGFTEQGFSLYIMSFWNSFDLGILLILSAYYCLRIVGLMTDVESRKDVASLAYDVLAINAVLLFPRLFSVLDHFRYFSQLLVAFRLMARDLMAILILIVIVCSGFFVAFSLGFGNDSFKAGNVVYTLFQLVMGFTPAAWDQWDNYNALGRAMLVLFLFITHFLIVTILITVLTNSFMAIAQNAHEEHQFVFAVNTISMVKSDALFSYIAPTNIIAWLLTPLRFALPLRSFIRLNRFTIKATHFPLLWSIYLYEVIVLRASHFEPIELIERPGRRGRDSTWLTLTGEEISKHTNHRLRRERSIATFQKDRALDEVFRRPFKDDTFRATKSQERRRKSTVVSDWMSTMGPEGRASPPVEQDHEIVSRLERTSNKTIQSLSRGASRRRAFSSASRSIASNPEDFLASQRPRKPTSRFRAKRKLGTPKDEPTPAEDADGDDEMATNDDDNNSLGAHNASDKEDDEQHSSPLLPRLHHSLIPLRVTPTISDREPTITFDDFLTNSPRFSSHGSPVKHKRPYHHRNISTNTILYNPLPNRSSAASPPILKRSSTNDSSNLPENPAIILNVSPAIPQAKSRTPPKRSSRGASRARPIMPPRSGLQSTPNITIPGLVLMDSPSRRQKRSALALDLASDLGDNKVAPDAVISAMPASLATQMGWAMRGSGTGRVAVDRELDKARQRGLREFNNDQSRMSKLMLARMNELEKGFKEVLREVKEWKKGEGSSLGSFSDAGAALGSVGKDSEGRRGRQIYRRGEHTSQTGVDGEEKQSVQQHWSEGSELSHDEAPAASSV